MALPISLELTLVAADVKIVGENSMTYEDREDTIECVSFDHAGTKNVANKNPKYEFHDDVTYHPIRIAKRIDEATPYLAQAFFKHQKVKGVFRFFRPSPSGDGNIVHFFTLEMDNGYVAEHEITSPSTVHVTSANEPPLERVGFLCRELSYKYELKNITTVVVF